MSKINYPKISLCTTHNFVVFFYASIEPIKTQRRTETAMILLRYRLGDYSVMSSIEQENEFMEKYDQCLVDCPSDGPPMHEQMKKASSPATEWKKLHFFEIFLGVSSVFFYNSVHSCDG